MGVSLGSQRKKRKARAGTAAAPERDAKVVLPHRARRRTGKATQGDGGVSAWARSAAKRYLVHEKEAAKRSHHFFMTRAAVTTKRGRAAADRPPRTLHQTRASGGRQAAEEASSAACRPPLALFIRSVGAITRAGRSGGAARPGWRPARCRSRPGSTRPARERRPDSRSRHRGRRNCCLSRPRR